MPPEPLPEYPHCPPLTRQAYGRWFTDTGLWLPYVEAVARRHALPAPDGLSAGTPGSHPVFTAGSGYVVKFYAPHWPESCAAERAAYAAAAGASLPIPRLLAHGDLYPLPAATAGDRWPWPYIVMSRLPGRSVGAFRPRLRRGELTRVARDLAPILRTLHLLPPPDGAGDGSRSAITARWYARWSALLDAAVDRRRAEGGWSEGLLADLPAYVRGALHARDPAAPCLVHADLTADHVLLVPWGDRWAVSGVIDFADAFAGEPCYELVALYLSLFQRGTAQLRAFLRAYGQGPLTAPGWRRRATACLLIFPYGVMPELGERAPAARSARRCADLEYVLWDGASGPTGSRGPVAGLAAAGLDAR